MNLERAGLALLRGLEPETAHGLALRGFALRRAAGLAPRSGPVEDPRLSGDVWGLPFANPIGIAAGFDKNAEAVEAGLGCGAGFVEIGAVTPRPQQGNPRPRLFRLPQDRAAINRFGFNNQGMEAVAARLERARGRGARGVVGVNLGANKDSEDKAEDYAAVLTRFAGCADFFTVNVSSPNTERLRDLQGREALEAVARRCLAARDAAAPGKPVVVKIAPDLDEAGLDDVAAAALAAGVDGLVATNTTLARDDLLSAAAAERGGLSGAPLFERSTAVLRGLARRTEGRVPLIGVGGIETAEQAYAKIRAGARLVQLYTAMIYEGPSLTARLAEGLSALLRQDGFSSVSEAVSADLRA
ncbi:MAG: quinone-dependent dihydroorotate dehydrogenase [Pseudomonadota bacterium]